MRGDAEGNAHVFSYYSGRVLGSDPEPFPVKHKGRPVARTPFIYLDDGFSLRNNGDRHSRLRRQLRRQKPRQALAMPP